MLNPAYDFAQIGDNAEYAQSLNAPTNIHDQPPSSRGPRPKKRASATGWSRQMTQCRIGQSAPGLALAALLLAAAPSASAVVTAPVSDLAVGSPEYLWAIDATDPKQLYRRDPQTRRLVGIRSNLDVDDLDVSAEGLMVALSGGQLYHWDEASRTFTKASSSQALDRVAIGPGVLWGLSGTTAYRWDATGADFVAVSQDLIALSVAKNDGTVYAVSSDGQLLRYDRSRGTFDALPSERNLSDLIDLTAVDRRTLWALTSGGDLLQWDYTDGRFVDLGARLPSDIAPSAIEIDAEKILYSIEQGKLAFHDVHTLAYDAYQSRFASSPAYTVDSDGKHHLVFNQGGAVHHAYAVPSDDGTPVSSFLESKPIVGSVSGTDHNIATDADGTVHASWISGITNDAEVYYATGTPNGGTGGYDWTIASQVSTDAVNDADLQMLMTPQGAPVFLTSKHDWHDPHGDRDHYQHSPADGSIPGFYAIPINGDDAQPSGTILLDPMRSLTHPSGLLGASSDSYSFGLPTNVAFELGSDQGDADGPEGFAWHVSLKFVFLDYLGDNTWDNSGSVYATFKETGGEPDEPEAEVRMGVTLDYHSNLAGESSVSLGLNARVKIEIPIASTGSSEQLKVMSDAVPDTELSMGIVLEFDGNIAEWETESAADEDEGGDDDNPICEAPEQLVLTSSSATMPDWIRLTDANGNPPTPATDHADIRLHFDPKGLSQHILDLIVSAPAATAPGSAATTLTEEILCSDIGWGAGFYAEAKTGGVKIKGEALGQAKYGNWCSQKPEISYGVHTLLKAKIFFITWTILDASYMKSQSPGALALGPTTASYSPGGTAEVHQSPGATPVLGDGTSTDLIDQGAISAVTLDGASYGFFAQETGDEDLVAVYSLTGKTTGSGITWDSDSLSELTGSGGFDYDPLVATHANDGLVVAWGGVPAASDDCVSEETGSSCVEELADTPPGSLFVLRGSDATRSTELSGLSDDPSSATGYALTNDKALYGIGASAARIGDVDGGGTVDLLFGAPDAEIERGRAYLVLGEHYQQATMIDDLTGSQGLLVEGATDSELGFAVSSAGQFGGDANPDIAIGAPGVSDHAGAVYLLYGGDTLRSSEEIVDADNSPLIAVTLLGGEDAEFGSALSGGVGLDATLDGQDDLLIGAPGIDEVHLFSGATAPLRIISSSDSSQSQPAQPIGGEVALLPDVNGDGAADLLLGSDGQAFLLFGGETLVRTATSFVTAWKGTGCDGERYRFLVSFRGSDADLDGVLRGRTTSGSTVDGQANELDFLLVQVYRAGVLVGSYDTSNQQARATLNLNYSLGDGQVLASGGKNQSDGLDIGRTADGMYQLHSGGDKAPAIQLRVAGDQGGTLVDEEPTDDAFDVLSTGEGVALDSLSDIPGLGTLITTNVRRSLQVAAAGDVDGDGWQDMLLGIGAYQDSDSGQWSGGTSYLLFGSNALAGYDDEGLALDDMTPDIGSLLHLGGGALAPAGDLNDDGYDDLAVGAPYGAEAGVPAATLVLGGPRASIAAGPTYTHADPKSLAGSALAGVGDLDGDGKDDLLIGAPWSVDTDTIEALQAATRIQVATYGLSGNVLSPPSVTTFSGTSAVGIEPAALGSSPDGALLAWTESADADSLFSAFWDGSKWSDTGLVRQAPDGVLISDVSVATGKGHSSELIWQEQESSDSSTVTLLTATYDSKSDHWSTATADIDSATLPQSPDDGSGDQIQVQGSLYSVSATPSSEGRGPLKFHITRRGETGSKHVLRYRTRDITASAGADYQHTEGKLTFGPGVTHKQITVPIYRDKAHEPRGERVSLDIASDHPSATLVSGGLTVEGDAQTCAEASIGDEDSVLELTAIDSGFLLTGELSSRLGQGVSGAGDFDGDGRNDFLVGAPAANDNKGLTYLIYGKDGMQLDDEGKSLDALGSGKATKLVGTDSSGRAGTAVASGTVQNGKRFIAVSAPGRGDGHGQVYVFTNGMLARSTASMNLDQSHALRLHLGSAPPGDDLGAALAVGDVDNNGYDDLLILATGAASDGAAPGRVYVVYDTLLSGAGAKSLALDASNSNIDIIENGSGHGMGAAIAVGDFNADHKPDLVLGAPRANALSDTMGIPRGYGGRAFVIWGNGGRLNGPIDLANLGSQGIILDGESTLLTDKGEASGDADTTAWSSDPAAGYNATDGVGNAAAFVKIDGSTHLAIGAPRAFVPGSDGPEEDDAQRGRVYLLAGGSQWTGKSGHYPLASLYKDSSKLPPANAPDYTKGLVLEGTASGNRTGSSLANAGSFRPGVDDSGTEDLLIGASSALSGAGQVYLVFGSQNYYDLSNATQGDNRMQLDPVMTPCDTQVPLLFAFQGVTGDLDADNPQNAGLLGTSVAAAGVVYTEGIDDNAHSPVPLAVLGAPSSDVDGVSQVYLAAGHDWVLPGQSLNVADLRSDQGFVITSGGMPYGVGDFDGDGLDDFVIAGGESRLVLGANPDISKGMQREYLINDAQHHVRWSPPKKNGNTYVVDFHFSGIDANDDGWVELAELSSLDVSVTRNGSLYDQASLADMVEDWAFYYYPSIDQIRTTGNTALVIMLPKTVVAATGGSLWINDGSTTAAQVTAGQLDSYPFKTLSGPIPQMVHGYQADWRASKDKDDQAVRIGFSGTPANQTVLRGRKQGDPGSNKDNPGAHWNGVTGWDMRVYGSNRKLVERIYNTTQQLEQNTQFNLNFYPDAMKIHASHKQTNADDGFLAGLSAKTDWVLKSTDDNVIKLQYDGKTEKSPMGDDQFYLDRSPLTVLGPVVPGDFDADGYDDFFLFGNAAQGSPIAIANAVSRGGLKASLYRGQRDAQSAIDAAAVVALPLHIITGVAAGDLNADGYDDLAISGYMDQGSGGSWGIAPNTAYVLAWYGGPDAIDLTTKPVILDAEPSHPSCTVETSGTGSTSKVVLATADIQGDGQDELIAYDLARKSCADPPIPFLTAPEAGGRNSAGMIRIYGAASVGASPAWHASFSPSGLFAPKSQGDQVGYTAGRQVDLNGDGLDDIALAIYGVPSNGSFFPDGLTVGVAYGTGKFNFEDGNGKTTITSFLTTDGSEPGSLSTMASFPLITGIDDFNADGNQDLFLGSYVTSDWSWIAFGSKALEGKSYSLSLGLGGEDDPFDDGVYGLAIEGLTGLKEPYALGYAGDLNGDGYGDVVMGDTTHGLAYAIYGYRPTRNAQEVVLYKEGSNGSDTFAAVSTSDTTVDTLNISGRSGNDFLQSVTKVPGEATTYALVIYGGPGDDRIGLSTVELDSLRRIDGGSGYDTLFLNPSYNGSDSTLDLAQIAGRVTGIELIDLGDTNRLRVSGGTVRELSDTQSVLVRGSNATVEATDAEQWCLIGQSPWDGVVYDIYRYHTSASCSAATATAIQLGVESGSVLWSW